MELSNNWSRSAQYNRKFSCITKRFICKDNWNSECNYCFYLGQVFLWDMLFPMSTLDPIIKLLLLTMM